MDGILDIIFAFEFIVLVKKLLSSQLHKIGFSEAADQLLEVSVRYRTVLFIAVRSISIFFLQYSYLYFKKSN